MKKIYFLGLAVLIFLFSSCKNVKIEEDYYYEETETVDGMNISLKGKGYGLYGQMIAKYKSGSIKDLMNGKPMKIKTSSADDNNASYNEIYLSFEVNGLVKTIKPSVDVEKIQGLSQIRIYSTNSEDKESSIYTFSASPFEREITVNKEVKAIVLYIKAYKFYPTDYNSLIFKGTMKKEEFEELKGKKVDNEFVINYVQITR